VKKDFKPGKKYWKKRSRSRSIGYRRCAPQKKSRFGPNLEEEKAMMEKLEKLKNQ